MEKSVCALVRRPDLSRAAFHDYYETHHAPLALQHFPFKRYVRNHLLNEPDMGFDTMSEFWADDIAAVAGLMQGPVGAIMREDEQRFMDQPRNAPAGAEEYAFSPRDPECSDALRSIHLLNWSGNDATQREEVLAHARELSRIHAGISVDFANSWSANPFPAKAVMWCDGDVELPPSSTLVSVRRLLARRCETSP